MEKRQKKQTMVLVAFLAVFGLVSFSVYFLVHTPETCFDGILNQNEEGVDCGGNCKMVCEPEKEDIQLTFSKVIPTLPNRYNVALEIYNPNKSYGVGELKYFVEFLDRNQSVINVYEGLSYILPQSSKTIVLNAIEMNEKPQIVKIDFDEISWIKLSETEAVPRVSVKDKFFKEVTDGTSFGLVNGVAVNRSNFDFDRVDVSILLLDSNKNIIDVTTTEIRTLLSGEEREFKANWFYPVTLPDSVEIKADTNVFNSENFMKRYGTIEEFQKF